jgi:hypothetical protein
VKISPEELDAIRLVLTLAEQWGYGNLISHLRTGWRRRMIRNGDIGPDVDLELGGGPGYPIKMQEDLLDGCEWDETGERYR